MGLVSPVAPASSRWLTMSTTLSVRTRRHDDFARLSWGKIRLAVWTHKIDRLTERDFIFAAKADRQLTPIAGA